MSRIGATVDHLRRFPRMGRRVPEIDRAEICELIEPPFRIVYQIMDNRVQIMAVIHGARDFNAALDDDFWNEVQNNIS